MSILNQLGININAFYLFWVFLIAYLALQHFIFSPYFEAYLKREQRTKGGEETAGDLGAKSLQLQSEYETKARNLSEQVKQIFDDQKALATQEYESKIASARQDSEKIITQVRTKVTEDIKQATEDLKKEVPSVAAAITNKMLQ